MSVTESVSKALRQAVRAVGIPEGRLRSDLPEYFGIPGAIPPDPVRHWGRVMARSRGILKTLPPITGPRVALISTVAKMTNNHGYAAVLAYALRLRGADPFFVYCDSALDGCERTTMLHMSPQEFINQGSRRICSSCYLKGQELYQQTGLPTYRLTDFLDAAVRAEITAFAKALPPEEYFSFTYKGLELGLQVECSVARFFFTHTPRLDERSRPVSLRFVRAALTMAEATLRMNAQLAPDVFAPCYGLYVTRGTPWLVARSLNKRCVTWARADVEETIALGNGSHPILELASREKGPWNDVLLEPAQENRLKKFLARNEQGTSARAVNMNALVDRERIAAELQLDPKRSIVALYTNCGFDSRLVYSTPMFPDTLTWTFDAIERFKGRQEQLVVRVHPYESRISQAEQTADLIRDRFPVLPPNVRVIPSDHRVSSYVLGEMADVVMVYGSQIGLEMAAQGKPVIVAGRGGYWGKGFTYDVHTREDYDAILGRLQEIAQPNPQRTEAARKFAYYYYVMRQIPLPAFNHDVREGLNHAPWWRTFRDLGALAQGKNADLDAICDQIISGREALAAGT